MAAWPEVHYGLAAASRENVCERLDARVEGIAGARRDPDRAAAERGGVRDHVARGKGRGRGVSGGVGLPGLRVAGPDGAPCGAHPHSPAPASRATIAPRITSAVRDHDRGRSPMSEIRSSVNSSP